MIPIVPVTLGQLTAETLFQIGQSIAMIQIGQPTAGALMQVGQSIAMIQIAQPTAETHFQIGQSTAETPSLITPPANPHDDLHLHHTLGPPLDAHLSASWSPVLAA